MLPKVRDQESTTLVFVIIGFVALVFRFAFAGLDVLGMGTVPVMTGIEFAAGFTSIIGMWQIREYKAKDSEHANA